jgi:radical SAM superfamily enzyme YgiQ (UPF0313 family)
MPRRTRLLLVNPRFPESFWSFRWAVDEILPDKRALNPPLGLATLAALCPPDWDVRIVDENVESIPLEPEADIVGVCGMGVQYPRQQELLAYYRNRGHFVVAGGSYASLCPERFDGLADSVICGEAEYIWKRFCADFVAGGPAPLYRETGVVALADSPAPRFDLLRLERYSAATMQFSRGCPFMCDFCDIIVMFGRKPRFKSCEQIGSELDLLRARGVRNVFFVDDNFIGNPKAARTLLAFLRDYQARHDYRFAFGTEVSINLAHDEALMRLMRAAGFGWVFVGIESPDPASLAETRKMQNLREDVLTSVRRMYAHGIDVLGGFIVGFDNDTLETFDLQERFIVESGIQAAMIGLLTALPHTPLYRRLESEGRLIVGAANVDNTKPATNFTPLRMPYDAMVGRYETLLRSLVADRAIAQRIRNKLRHLSDPASGPEYTVRQRAAMVWRLLAKGIWRGGPRRMFHFARSLPLTSPRRIPQAILDWIAGLSMRDYVDRHFASREAPASLERLIAHFRNEIRPYVEEGSAAVLMENVASALPRLSLLLAGGLDRAFFAHATRHLERFLQRSSAKVVLRVESLGGTEAAHVDRLLRRLARYGDRISIVTSARWLRSVAIDSSVFHLVVEPDAASL